MLLFYTDECGAHSMNQSAAKPGHLKQGVSRYFTLVAVGVHDSSRMPLAREIVEVKRKHLGAVIDDHPWGNSEIKGNYVVRASKTLAEKMRPAGPPGYAALDTPAKAEAFVRDLGLLFATFRPIVFVAVIDKRAMLDPHLAALAVPVKGEPAPPAPSALGTAYAIIHQRIAYALDRYYPGDAAIIVADQQSEHEAVFRQGELHRVRDELTAPLPRKPNYNLILDKPLWVDTDLSSWDREIIQLADIVAYSSNECMLRGEAPKEPHYLWDQIRPCLAANWSSGRARGGGFVVHPGKAAFPVL